MKRWLLVWGYRIALVGAVSATLGDFLQLWVVNAGRPELLLAGPPENTIVFATLAGSLGIPLYGLGYYVRANRACESHPDQATLLALTGAAFGTLGGIVHGVTGISIASEIGEIASGLAPMEGILASGPIVIAFWALATVSLLAVGVSEATLFRGHSDRLFNPLVLTLVFTAVAALLASPWNDFVGPAAVNIAHTLFFARLVVFDR